MIATVDDVVNGVRALWAAAGLPALVTGGLHDWRQIPAALAPPYAVARVRPGDKATMTGGIYTEKFEVVVWLHTDSATDGRNAVGRRLPAIDFGQRAWPAKYGRCLHVRPVGAPTDPSPLANLARDIAVTAAAWDVLMQQTRALTPVR